MNVPTSLEHPLVFERWWLPPIYTCSAAFVLDGTGLTPSRIAKDLQPLSETARTLLTRKWPLVLTQLFIVPVYCASSFLSETVSWLMMHRTGLGRFRAILNPVLYNTKTNMVEFKEAAQNHNLNYYTFLKPLYGAGISKAAQHFGHEPRLTRDKYDSLVAEIRRSRVG